MPFVVVDTTRKTLRVLSQEVKEVKLRRRATQGGDGSGDLPPVPGGMVPHVSEDGKHGLGEWQSPGGLELQISSKVPLILLLQH